MASIRLLRSALREVASLLWLLLTSVAHSHPLSKILASKQGNRSPRVRRVTFFPYLLHIRHKLPDDFGLRRIMPSRPVYAASYAVPVRQIEILLTASFRPYLTIAALAV